MIQISNLSKSFGKNVLFSDLNLTINDGDFVAFIGASGSGKTTLLNMIGAIEPLGSGIILVDGIDIAQKHNQLKYFQQTVGFLFQNFALVENKTVKENLEMIKPKFRSNLALTETLNIVGLSDKLNEKIYTLSGGQQQRIALARLLLKKCSIILADEPTGALDAKNATFVFNYLKKMNTQYGKTVIIVTHDLRISELCDRVIKIGSEL